MESVPFIIERRLNYHGIWNAGYNIGDLFFKNVSREFVSKPPYPAILRLSSGSLTLTVFRRGDQTSQAIRTDAIPFDALRDITVNDFNSRCLMIIYVNNKNKFSVLVNSCQDSKQTRDIAAAFKKLRELRQQNKSGTTQANSNWIMRKNGGDDSSQSNDELDSSNKTDDDDNANDVSVSNGTSVVEDGLLKPGDQADNKSIKSRTDSTVLNENFEFLNAEEHDTSFDDENAFDDGDGDYYDDNAFYREEGPGDNSSTVGVQVNLQDRSHRLSVSSTNSSSIMSFQSLRDEIDSIVPVSSIAKEEYTWKKTETFDTDDDQQDGSNNVDHSQMNGHGIGNNIPEIKINPAEEYDFRSVGTQTDSPVQGFERRHYTKRPASFASSNVYRAMASQRRSKQNGMDSPISTGTTTSISTSTSMNHTPSIAVPTQISGRRPVSYHGPTNIRGGNAAYPPSFFTSRKMGTTGTTVARPIENVYRSQTWSRMRGGDGKSRKRRIMVVSSGRNSLRI